jgi:hypothetical protein
MSTEKKWKFNKIGMVIAEIGFHGEKIDKGEYYAGQPIVS